MNLSKELSAYLDFLRFMAAIAVLLGHLEQLGFKTAWMGLTYFSHEAVIVFFVLSGFIIHHSTTTKKISARDFAIARLSRIYSVALPAVVVCSLIPIILTATTTSPDRVFSWVDVISSLLFMNESWTNPAALATNPPYWSLCYEVWFYVLFGLFVFVRNPVRWPIILLASLIAGPAIILLLPVWLIGTWMSARMRWNSSWSSTYAWVAFLGPIGLIILINRTGFDLEVRSWLKEMAPPMWRVESAQRFATDYVIGILVAIHIRAFTSLPSNIKQCFERYRTVLANLAGFSFTLYLFHWPMLVLAKAFAPATPTEILYPIIVGLITIISCWIVSLGTERQLSNWRHFIAQSIFPAKTPKL